MTGRWEEADRLVEIAKRAVAHIDGDGANARPSGLLLLAYHRALTDEWGRTPFDAASARQIDYAKAICKLAGAEPDMLVTDVPATVTKALGTTYWLPVLDYRPEPLWMKVLRHLPEVPGPA